MDAFYADNGIELNLRPIGNENLLQFMKGPGHEDWDAFSVNQGDNQYYYSQGILSDITVDEVPNLAAMYPVIADNPVWKVSDGVYNAVPWTFGALGINYIRETVPEGITSYAQALDPKYRVGTFDSSLNMVSTGACAVGLDPVDPHARPAQWAGEGLAHQAPTTTAGHLHVARRPIDGAAERRRRHAARGPDLVRRAGQGPGIRRRVRASQ